MPARRASGAPAEVVIATASGLLGTVADMAVAPDGALYVSDPVSHRIHRVEPSTGKVLSWGRDGDGPGELRAPSDLGLRGDTVLVVDAANGRLQRFAADGGPAGSSPLPPGFYAPFLGADDAFVQPTLGMETSLAIVYDSGGEERLRLGTITGQPTNMVRLRSLKEGIARGEVPAIMLNTVVARRDPEGSTWLWSEAAGRVERYGPEGGLLWSVTLDEPGFEEVMTAFQAANRTAAANSMPPLRYILDGALVGGDLWLLLGPSRTGPASIRVLRPDGALGPAWTLDGVTGAGKLAVDAEGRWLYLALVDRAEVVRVPLPRAD